METELYEDIKNAGEASSGNTTFVIKTDQNGNIVKISEQTEDKKGNKVDKPLDVNVPGEPIKDSDWLEIQTKFKETFDEAKKPENINPTPEQEEELWRKF